MKIIGLVLILTISAHVFAANNLDCSNPNANLNVAITLTGPATATIRVISPFKKLMTCSFSDFDNKGEIFLAFACGTGAGLPSILDFSKKSMKGFIEVVNQPHYDLTCREKLK